MMMKIFLVERKFDDDFLISGEEKLNEFFISIEEKRRAVAEQ